MEALDAHLRSCRPSCSLLGSTVRLQALHPGSQPTSPDESPLEVESRRAPLPAFTLSRPSALRPAGFDGLPPEERPAGPGGAADEEEAEAAEEEVLAARAALERQFALQAASGVVPPPPPPPPNVRVVESVAGASTEPAAVLASTMEWWRGYYSTVHRLFGHRQRRVVCSASSAEEVFASFWSEAARLFGDVDAAALPAGVSALCEPDDALSSLIVVAGEAAELDAYRAVRQNLALALALLGLAESFTLSAFHPRDTFELRVEEDGSRTWTVTLPHPLVHIVKRKSEK